MFLRLMGVTLALAVLALTGGTTQAQILDRKVISLAEAKKMAVAAQAEAAKNKWRMVVAVVDADGTLIYLERADDVQTGSIEVAIEKARTAAMFNRSTTVLEAAVTGTKETPGRPGLLKLFPMPAQGGLPVKVGDYFIGAIGCSGGTSPQDEQSCAAGLATLGK